MQVTSLVDGIQRLENCSSSTQQFFLRQLTDVLVYHSLENIATIVVWSDKINKLIVNNVLE